MSTLKEELLYWVNEEKRNKSGVTTCRNTQKKILGPFIDRYEDVNPPICGHTGGWELDEINSDGRVYLKHECFYAHRYDYHDVYYADVSLDELLSLTETKE